MQHAISVSLAHARSNRPILVAQGSYSRLAWTRLGNCGHWQYQEMFPGRPSLLAKDKSRDLAQCVRQTKRHMWSTEKIVSIFDLRQQKRFASGRRCLFFERWLVKWVQFALSSASLHWILRLKESQEDDAPCLKNLRTLLCSSYSKIGMLHIVQASWRDSMNSRMT